jgi:2-dehydro-3-deoxygalactonokinase
VASSRGLLASLFSVRARSLLEGIDPPRNRAYLSGLLIGDELAAARKLAGSDAPVVLCGSSGLTALYSRACRTLGLNERLRFPARQTSAMAASIGHWRLDSLRTG